MARVGAAAGTALGVASCTRGPPPSPRNTNTTVTRRTVRPVPRTAKAGAERELRKASTVRPALLAPSSVCKASRPSATTARPCHMHRAKAANTRSLKRSPTRSPTKATQALHRSIQEGRSLSTCSCPPHGCGGVGGKAGCPTRPRPHQNPAYSSMIASKTQIPSTRNSSLRLLCCDDLPEDGGKDTKDENDHDTVRAEYVSREDVTTIL